jgi:hypothetical protein
MTVFKNIAMAVLIVTIPGLAQAWQANNRHTVNPVSDTVFEVVGRPGSGGPEFWCAAGDYASRVLGAHATQRVYLVRGPAPAQTRHWNRAVLFSLVVPQDADLRTGITLSVTRVGENLNAASAQAYCMDDKFRDI